MRVLLQPGFVLFRRPYRNTSLILEVFSRDHGRVGLVARGVRSAKGRRRAALQPFMPLLLSWDQRGELGRLSAVEEAAGPLAIPPMRLFSALYVNELLLRLLARDDPHPELFPVYCRCLVELSLTEANEEAVLRRFELALLADLGYALPLAADCDGAPLVAGREYRFLPQLGAVPTERGGVGVAVSGATLLALAAGRLDEPEVLRQAKPLTRAALAALLAGKPLHSRALLLARHRRRGATC
ncbi:MAG TPA: DNA repair protein RecO [Candidatus Competibacteraceae bacterium]|nr:DNA repair protein RecO [Candidatus Competibacteraceae bacterium]